jgi:hypothetical protein
MKPIKILVDSDLIEEYFLHRNNRRYLYAERLIQIIFCHPELKVYLTKRCINNIFDPEDGIDLSMSEFRNFNICCISKEMRQKARQWSDLKIEAALELECGFAEGITAIISEEPDKYGKQTSPIKIWYVDQLSSILRLNSIPVRSRESQLCIFPTEPSSSKEVIRNTAKVIVEALKVLKTAGNTGVTPEALSSELNRSAKTTQSIIWDLENFFMAYTNKIGMVCINQDLLGSKTEDISNYLSMVLRDNLLVKEILKEIELKQSITESGLDYIIKRFHSYGGELKGKTVRSYRCRITSWLIAARLVEKKNNYKFVTFVIPSSENVPKTDSQNEVNKQLDLFDLQYSS